MPSNRTATKARAISRNRSIIGCPLTGNSLSRRLTVDGVDNKANGRFCRLAGMGMAQPWWYSLPQSGVPSGAIRIPHASRIDVHIAPDVGATSFGSPPVANRAHRRSNLGRSARGRSRGAITRLDVGMGYSGSMSDHSEHFWIDGGECGEGRAVSWSRPDRAASCCSGASAEAVPFPDIGGRSTSLLNSKGIERGWP